MVTLRTALTLAVILQLLACSSVTRTSRPASLSEATQIASKPGKQEVEVKYWTVGGQASRRGVVAPFDAEAFVVTEPSGQSKRIPFASAQSLSFDDRSKGMRNGLIAGALSGALLGFIAGAAIGGMCMDSDRPCSEQDHSFAYGGQGALLVGAIFGAIGGVIGVAVGHRTTLTF
jgi:hypothetical protein